jgi:hypothetical protein
VKKSLKSLRIGSQRWVSPTSFMTKALSTD